MAILHAKDTQPASLNYTKYTMMKCITFLSFIGLVVLAACAAPMDITAQQDALYAHQWSLKKIHTDTGTETVATKAFIRFDKEKGSAGGNGSCNSFGSNAAVNNREVSITQLFSTKMYCEEVQKTENAFFNHLALVNKFEVKDKTLLLYQGDKVLLEFEAVPN